MGSKVQQVPIQHKISSPLDHYFIRYFRKRLLRSFPEKVRAIFLNHICHLPQLSEISYHLHFSCFIYIPQLPYHKEYVQSDVTEFSHN